MEILAGIVENVTTRAKIYAGHYIDGLDSRSGVVAHGCTLVYARAGLEA